MTTRYYQEYYINNYRRVPTTRLQRIFKINTFTTETIMFTYTALKTENYKCTPHY